MKTKKIKAAKARFGQYLPVVVFGAGGHAKVILDILAQQKRYKAVAVIDPAGRALDGGTTLLGVPVLKTLPKRISRGIVAIGDNWLRSKVVGDILRELPLFEFVSAVHPSAVLANDIEPGAGTVIMAGACINLMSRIGSHCIVNTRAVVDHDCVLGDFSSLAPGVTLGGGVQIGQFAALGVGAACAHGLSIGGHAVVGVGAAIVRNVPANVVAFGVPCRVVRKRKPGDRYL